MLLNGGWQLNGTMVYQTGFPLFIYQQNLNSNIGTGEQRPNATGISPSMPGSDTARLYNYINPAAFTQAPAFTFGNVFRSSSWGGWTRAPSEVRFPQGSALVHWATRSV